jgi:hypothetical protein
MKLSPQNMLRLQQLISALSHFCLAVTCDIVLFNFVIARDSPAVAVVNQFLFEQQFSGDVNALSIFSTN